MMKILTENYEEYNAVKELLEENGLSVTVIKQPKDSIASVCWSIEDVRGYFPEGTPDEVILDGLLRIEKPLQAQMTADGWETIDALKDTMLKALDG